MFKANIIALLFIFIPLQALAGSELFRVSEIINGKSFRVDVGDTVRLASIEAPNIQEKDSYGHYGRPGEPLGEEAKQELASLIAGKKVRIDYNPGRRDRHNRLLGQVYDEKGIWIQGEMLRHGYAQVYSFSDDTHEMIEKMLQAERQARKAKLGVWNNPYYRIISTEEAGEFINRFRIVEGVVASVNENHGNIYINFNRHWKGNFAIFISHKNTAAFASLDMKSLEGRKARVRGWIHYHHAPMIDINHSEQLEVE